MLTLNKLTAITIIPTTFNIDHNPARPVDHTYVLLSTMSSFLGSSLANLGFSSLSFAMYGAKKSLPCQIVQYSYKLLIQPAQYDIKVIPYPKIHVSSPSIICLLIYLKKPTPKKIKIKNGGRPFTANDRKCKKNIRPIPSPRSIAIPIIIVFIILCFSLFMHCTNSLSSFNSQHCFKLQTHYTLFLSLPSPMLSIP